MKKLACWFGGLMALIAVITIVYINAGVYDVAADVPHWTVTRAVLDRVSTASIARRSNGIEVPALEDAALVTSGAGNYNAMCAGCHLKPGLESTELSRGLYPPPPSLIDKPLENPAATFWVIKHGIKMTGMPAWGKSMEDQYVWGIVAFLNKLPSMSADHYDELVEASGGHQHGGSESLLQPESSGSGHESDESHSHEHPSAGADDRSKAPIHQH